MVPLSLKLKIIFKGNERSSKEKKHLLLGVLLEPGVLLYLCPYLQPGDLLEPGPLLYLCPYLLPGDLLEAGPLLDADLHDRGSLAGLDHLNKYIKFPSLRQ